MDSGSSEKGRRGRHSPVRHSRNGESNKHNDRRRRDDSRSRDRGTDRSRTQGRVWERQSRTRRRDDSRRRTRRSTSHSRSRGRGNGRSDILPPPTIRSSKFSSPPSKKSSAIQSVSPPPPPDVPPPPPPTTLPPPPPPMQRSPVSQMPCFNSDVQFCKAPPSSMPPFLKNSAPPGFSPPHALHAPGTHGRYDSAPLRSPPNVPLPHETSMRLVMNAPTAAHLTFPPFPADSYPSSSSRRGVQQANQSHLVRQPPLDTDMVSERRGVDNEQRRGVDNEQHRSRSNERRYRIENERHQRTNEVAQRRASRDSRSAKRRKPEAEPRVDKVVTTKVDSPSESLDMMMERAPNDKSSNAEREAAPRIPTFTAPDWNHPTGAIAAPKGYDPFGIFGPPSKYKYKELTCPPKRDDLLEVLFSAHAVPSTEYLDKLASRLCARGTKSRVIMPTGPHVCMDMIHCGRCKTKRCPYEHDPHQVAQWKSYFSRTPCSGGYECSRRDRGCHYRHVAPGKAA